MRKGRPLPACPAGVLHGDSLRTASIYHQPDQRGFKLEYYENWSYLLSVFEYF
jgi:hypothetical protein